MLVGAHLRDHRDELVFQPLRPRRAHRAQRKSAIAIDLALFHGDAHCRAVGIAVIDLELRPHEGVEDARHDARAGLWPIGANLDLVLEHIVERGEAGGPPAKAGRHIR